jgi:N-acetyl-anhydromuramyl-L-alanine amidase AmpD
VNPVITKKLSILPLLENLMKSSTKIFTAFVATLVTFSQSAIATHSHVSPQHSIESILVLNSRSSLSKTIDLQSHILIAQQSATNKSRESYTKCKITVDNTNKYCFQKGNKGIYIQNLISLLSEIGYYRGKSTNQFDVGVEKSVARFQQDYRLKSSDGIVGNETLLHICKVTSKGCKPSDSNGCYTGSPRLVVSCLNDFRSDSEKDRSYLNK